MNLLARLVRVALVALVCDEPAAHKMGGFGSHSHNTFCIRCKIQKEVLQKLESYDPEGGLFFCVLYLCYELVHQFWPSPDE